MDQREARYEAAPENWDDERYVAENLDVKQAIAAGTFTSGYDHYVNFGVIEGRPPAWVSENNPTEYWPWSDSAYLEVNPNLALALADRGITPLQHYSEFGSKEGRATGLEWMLRELGQKAKLPDWAIKEMLQASYYEPALDAVNFNDPWIYNPFLESGTGNENVAHARAIRRAGDCLQHKNYDFVFFVPWIKKGGADLASLFHIRSVAKRYRRVAVFTTEPSVSEWASEIPKSVDLVHLGDDFGGSDMHKALVCYHIIAALQPKKVHVINSYPAWQMLKYFGKAVGSIAQIYVSLYCYDYTALGEPVGYARDVRKCIDGIAGIYTDNSVFRDHLVKNVGIDPRMIHVLSHPVAHSIPCVAAPARTNTRILWASRLDRQKQPTIIAKIARSLPGFTFDVYGTGVQGEDAKVIDELSKCENVRYRGGFTSLSDIPLEDYRCFLYTSLWDGLPNILLEMLAAGMLIVSSNVGGIGQDLGEDALVLVKDPTDPIAYAKALRWCFQNPTEAEAIRMHGHRLVGVRHTFDSFDDQLARSGYFSLRSGDAADALARLDNDHTREADAASAMSGAGCDQRSDGKSGMSFLARKSN